MRSEVPGLRDQRGFGMIEVMIAMGLVGVMSVAITSMMQMANKSGKSADQAVQAATLVSSVRSALADPTACKNALGSVVFTDAGGAAVDTIKPAKIAIVTGTGSEIPLVVKSASYSGLTVTDITFTRTLIAPGTEIDMGGGIKVKKYSLNIQLKMQKAGIDIKDASGTVIRREMASYGAQEILRQVDGLISVNTATQGVYDCSGSGGGSGVSPGDGCADMGGVWDQAQTPKCRIDRIGFSSDWTDLQSDAASGRPLPFYFGDKGIFSKHGVHSAGPVKIDGAGTVLDMATGDLVAKKVTTTDLDASGVTNAALLKSAAIELAGNFTATGTVTAAGAIVSGSSISVSSDERLKKGIRPLGDALERVLKLRGVSYRWKDKKRGEGEQLGFIAQEVEKIFPEVVLTGGDGLKSVAYQNMVAALVEAVKAQQTRIDRLDGEVTQLRQALAERRLASPRARGGK